MKRPGASCVKLIWARQSRGWRYSRRILRQIALPFDERMQRLVDYIYQEKYNGKIQRLIKSAKLRFPQANRQGVIYASRGLNRELIENLFSGQYIGLHQSIILQGIYRFREDLPGLCPGKRSLPEPCQGTVCQAA